MKRLIIFFLLPLQVCAQDITGLWTGFIHTTDKDLPYELAISENDGKLGGYSHTTFTVNGVEEIGVKAVTIKKKDADVLVEDKAFVFNDFSIDPVKGIRQFDFLVLIVEGNAMMLNGTFKTNKIRNYKSITGTIELRKIDTSKKTKIIPKLDELNLLNTLSFLQPKTKEKEVVAIATPEIEKVSTEIPTKKESDILPPVKIKESSSILQPKSKDTSAVAASINKQEIVPQPTTKEKDTAIVATSVKEDKQKIVQPKTKEKDTAVVTASVKQKKPEVILQPKEKAKEVVIASSSVGKKKEVISQSTQKQVANVPPPVSIKKSQPVSSPLEKEKQVAAILKPAAVKKDLRDTISKNAVTTSLPSVIKPTPVPVPVVSAAELSKRKTEMIQNVFFKSDSLLLSLYDNGEVDGDTVSVVLNGKVIIASQGLTTNAINKTIYITPDLRDSLQLVMYAENLGSIPPNTGLLILQDGNDRYEIRFAGDFQKNSAIILRRKRL